MTKTYKFKCLNCKKSTQVLEPKFLFNEGCPLCKSKRIKVEGYSKEVLI